MLMAKGKNSPPNLHGPNYIRNASDVFPCGRKTLGMMLLSVLLVLVLSAYSPEQIFLYPPMPAHNSHQTAINSPHDNAKACNLFNGTWVRDFGGPIYTNTTCPTIPEARNCAKYGKQMDYVNWMWKPHGCAMEKFEPHLFLTIVRGKTLAFAGDSIARNQMESLLCLLSQVEAPIRVSSDTKDKFVTWNFRSHNFTHGSLDQIHSRRFSKTNQWYKDNITSFSVPMAIQRVFRTALKNLKESQECRLQLTVVRTATSAHFENGLWNTGGSCNRTEPLREEAMIDQTEWAIRNAQVEEADRTKKNNGKGGVKIEIIDITKAMSMRPDAHPGPIDMWNELLLAVLNKYKNSLEDQ
nr:protein ALTERED XYLOGLUCAN 4-like [Oryza sativa Japonica Group]